MNDRPNILIIWSDDIGISNLSCYSDGLMGYRTPNIDRIAAEGVRFTDYYGEQSCTAGRAAFITGQNPYRTGLTKVGMPGAKLGLQAEDPTIADALKHHGYATGQFGKNHLGDRDEHLARGLRRTGGVADPAEPRVLGGLRLGIRREHAEQHVNRADRAGIEPLQRLTGNDPIVVSDSQDHAFDRVVTVPGYIGMVGV